jgi:hypothetical protein
MRWSLAASLVISCSAEVAEPAGLYHKIVNAHHRGELEAEDVAVAPDRLVHIVGKAHPCGGYTRLLLGSG